MIHTARTTEDQGKGKGVGRAPASILAWHGGMRHEPGAQPQRATRGQRTVISLHGATFQGSQDRPTDPSTPTLHCTEACISHNKMHAENNSGLWEMHMDVVPY
jgi:hypothetical protein